MATLFDAAHPVKYPTVQIWVAKVVLAGILEAAVAIGIIVEAILVTEIGIFIGVLFFILH